METPMKTLDQVIELNKQILRCAGLPDEDTTTTAGLTVYYLQQYRERIENDRK